LIITSNRQVSKGGEMHTIRYLGHEKGDARFQTHWNTFITEEDIATIGIVRNFEFLSNFGFNQNWKLQN
jgi:hypothetical protein